MPREQEIEFRHAVSKPASAGDSFLLALTISLLMHLALLQLGFSGSLENSTPSRPVLQVVIAEAIPDKPPVVSSSLAPASLVADPQPAEQATELAPAEPARAEPAPQDLLPAQSRPVFMTAPATPDGFQIGGDEGFVTLELTVGIDGRIVDAVVMEAGISEEYVAAIIELSRETLYQPARLGNRPVSGKAIIRFEYRPAEPLPQRYDWIPDYGMDQG